MTTYRWAVEWRTNSDGWFTWSGTGPLLFFTRREARAHITKECGFIKTRPDLRAEPHGWKMPRAVRVAVTLREVVARQPARRQTGRP